MENLDIHPSRPPHALEARPLDVEKPRSVNGVENAQLDQVNSVEPSLLLNLPTFKLLDELGAGRHKPGSGSAAALLGLIACKMMRTVILVTKRNIQYGHNLPQLSYIETIIRDESEPFFVKAVQLDSELFDKYYRASADKRNARNAKERKKLANKAREALVPATETPLEIAKHALDTAERGMIVYDLGVRHARGDSGVAVSAALSACSGALFIVYLNLLQFREGQWALSVRRTTDQISEKFRLLQIEQFRRVSRIQMEGIGSLQPELPLGYNNEDESIT